MIWIYFNRQSSDTMFLQSQGLLTNAGLIICVKFFLLKLENSVYDTDNSEQQKSHNYRLVKTLAR